MIKILENRIIAEFGFGDVGVNSVYSGKDYGLVVFNNQSPREIASDGDIQVGDVVDLENQLMVMKFYKKESIDVIIRALTDAKECMEDENE